MTRTPEEIELDAMRTLMRDLLGVSDCSEESIARRQKFATAMGVPTRMIFPFSGEFKEQLREYLK